MPVGGAGPPLTGAGLSAGRPKFVAEDERQAGAGRLIVAREARLIRKPENLRALLSGASPIERHCSSKLFVAVYTRLVKGRRASKF